MNSSNERDCRANNSSNKQTKPQTFNGDLHNLPPALDELKLKQNWVLWKWQQNKKGKWKKPPYQPTGSLAEVDQPGTWSSYPDVMTAYATGQFDGIGFVLANSNIGAFDLDKCRDLASEEIAPHAKEIMDQVGSYQEISPSGTGVRIIGTAIGEDYCSIKKNLEIYRNTARYVTITGNALNGTTAALTNIDAPIDSYRGTTNTKSSSMALIPLREIMEEEFEPIKWILPHYITEGCTLFAGRPKIGKSWWVLLLVMAVSYGGKMLDLQCESGDVLYCALEDNRRRMKARINKLEKAGAKYDMDHITIAHKMPRINSGAKAFIKNWVERVENPRLIIIDCLARVREPLAARQLAYDADYQTIEALQEIANKYNVAVIVVHHDRKLPADDPFDSVSGTLGLNGAADTIMIMQKKSDNNALLMARGRDIEEISRAIAHDDGMWKMLGDPVQLHLNEQRQRILEVLSTKPQPIRQIAKAAEMKYDNAKKILNRMYVDATILKEGRGLYYLREAWQ
jgi:hypothetical protein